MVKGRRYAVFQRVPIKRCNEMDVDCSARDTPFFTQKWRAPANFEPVQKKASENYQNQERVESKIRRRKKKPSIFIAIFTNPFYIARNGSPP